MQRENLLIKIWKIIYPVMIYFLISNIIAFVFMMIEAMREVLANQSAAANSYQLAQTLYDSINTNALVLTGVAQVVTIPVIAILYRLDVKHFPESVAKKNNATAYVCLFLLAAVSCIGFNNMIDLSHISEYFPGYEETAKILYGSNIYIELAVTVLLAPLIEELIFRGMVYRRIARYWNKNIALLASAVLFGIYHGNVVQGVYAFLLGLILAYLYEKFGTIKAPILAHGFANLVSVALTETSVFNYFFDSKNHRAVYLAVTFVTIILTFLFVFFFERYDSTIKENTNELKSE